jgi:hypothetical protein
MDGQLVAAQQASGKGLWQLESLLRFEFVH